MPITRLRRLLGVSGASPAPAPERASPPQVIRLGAAASVKLAEALAIVQGAAAPMSTTAPAFAVQPNTPSVEASNDAAFRRTLELARLDALHHQGDELYQLIARMAAHVCDAPIAAITLLDDHTQWLQGSYGLSVTYMPLELSFCQHALNSPHEMTVITDTHEDPRVALHPLVTGGPGLRFYAGAPLVTPEGLVMGTVCVLDVVPRVLTPTQNQALCCLADVVMRLLRLRAPAEDDQDDWPVRRAA